ncbi:MAG: DJ-1/PfpI family protein [Clostridium sp.]
MSKILIFIFNNMTDYEITFVSHLLGVDAGFEIIPIAYEDKIITSRSGIMYKPLKTVSDILNDYSNYDDGKNLNPIKDIENIKSIEYVKDVENIKSIEYVEDVEAVNVDGENIDGIIITGGWYGDTRPELLQLLNKIHAKGKLVAGICGAGTVFLAKSGILENNKYTTPITEWTQNHIDVFGPNDPFPRNNYISKRVVRDENVITAQGIAFIDFAVEICDFFNLFEDNSEKDTFYRNFFSPTDTKL